jgi:hypothetical protein
VSARLQAAMIAAALVLAGALPSAAPAQPASDALAAKVLAAVQAVHFEGVVDFGDGGRRIAHVPNVDVAVIALDTQGRATAAANVLLSRDYPRGQVVPIDGNWGTTAVRFTRWRQSRFDGFQGRGTDIVGGRSQAPYQFMAPYPASVFKVMVAYEVMRQVDRGRLHLASRLGYAGRPASGLCGPGTSTVRGWMDAMITWSSNQAACALIVRLHRLGAIGALNADLRSLGLATMQVTGTRASNGANWQDGALNMTALDTARLFWLIDGGQGTLWHRPDGRAVTAGELKPGSRAFLKRLLGQDAFADTLSTTVWCGQRRFGRVYPAAGIPQLEPARWLDRRGHVVVPGTGADFGRDVRPCNGQAQVTFAHKIGLVDIAASDAGIVTALPGQPYRHYVIAMFTNLGSAYGDPDWSRAGVNPCGASLGLCRTEKFAQLGGLIDAALVGGRTARHAVRGAAGGTGRVVARPGWRPRPPPDGRP